MTENRSNRFFNESLYLTTNPKVAQLITEGKYTSGLDYYTQIGQFEGDNETEGFFTGTEGSDVITGFGEDQDLAGVGIEASVDVDKIILKPTSLGVEEIDTLVGNANENGFYLGIPTVIDGVSGSNTTQALYIGEGTKDNGLIRNLGEGDYVYLAGDPTDYVYKAEGGDFKILSASGDLIGVVQDIPELQVTNYAAIPNSERVYAISADQHPSKRLDLNDRSRVSASKNFEFGIAANYEPGKEGFTLGLSEAGFNQSGWLSLYPDVKADVDAGLFTSALDQYLSVGQYEEGGWIFNGTAGNDTLISWTQNAEVRLSGVSLAGGFEPSGFDPGQYYFGSNPTSFGVGEKDILIHSTDTGTVTESLLGWFRSADGSIQRYYVGQGDDDYALVKNFNKNDKDELFLAGAPQDYTYEEVDGNLRIAYQGDLVAIAENVKYSDLELADEGEGSGAFVLIGQPEGTKPKLFDRTISVSPGSDLTITDFDPIPDVIQLIGSYEDYQVKTIDSDFQISTKDGKVVATVKGVADLGQFKGYTPNGTNYLVSLDNQRYDTLSSSFFEPYYAFNNPQAVEAVSKGEYESVFDYHVKVGQFAGEDAPTIPFSYWEGTSGNDTVTGIGEGIGLFGVDVTTIERLPAAPHGIIGIETASLGVGEVDVLVGQGGGGETVYNLGKTGLSTAPDPKPFYVGQGDADYALIQNFDSTAEEQFISLVGNPIDYEIEQAEGNTRISYHDDLIAIVQGELDLAVLPFLSRDGRFFLAATTSEGFQESVESTFYAPFYLAENPDVQALIDSGEYKSAFDHYLQVGRNNAEGEAVFSIAGFGKGSDLLFGVALTSVDSEKEGWTSSSTGAGERDTLIGGADVTTFFIGNDQVLDPSQPDQVYYVGQGDQDFAKIVNFDPTNDFIFGAGKFEDYAIAKVGLDLQISYQGDLVAKVANAGSLTLQEFSFGAERPRALSLVAPQNQFLTMAG